MGRPTLFALALLAGSTPAFAQEAPKELPKPYKAAVEDAAREAYAAIESAPHAGESSMGPIPRTTRAYSAVEKAAQEALDVIDKAPLPGRGYDPGDEGLLDEIILPEDIIRHRADWLGVELRVSDEIHSDSGLRDGWELDFTHPGNWRPPSRALRDSNTPQKYKPGKTRPVPGQIPRRGYIPGRR